MTSRENATISVSLACLALIAIVVGQWMTRPADMDLLRSMVAVMVIYAIFAGAPQMLIFVSAVSCIRRGHIPPSRWWTIVHLVLAMQFGAGATLIAGSITGREGLSPIAAMVLVVAALVAVASGLAAPRAAYGESNAARDA